MKKSLLIWMPLLAACAFTACSSDDSDDLEVGGGGGASSIATPTVTASTGTTLTVSSSYSGSNAGFKGFCYSTTNQSPTIRDNRIDVDVDADFTTTITGLMGGTTYYVRAFVYSDSRYNYSETLQATTASLSLDEQLESYVPPTYVDNYVGIAGWDQRSQWNLANVHDPTVMLAEDGFYYMYQTDASYGNAHTAGGHFHGRRSQNLVDWEYLGGTMPSLPSWVVPKLNEIRTAMGLPEANPDVSAFGYWAPCVRKVRDGLYRMYYSIVCPGYLDASRTSWSERAFIGLMETSNPADNDSWEDKGYVITNASDRNLNFYVSPTDWQSCYYKWNAIDPSYIIDNDGRHYLVYGSWHSGIAIVELDPETGKVLNELPNPWGSSSDIAAYGQLIATRQMGNRWQASEGPEIVYHDGYYYLFLAYDALDVPYNTRVVRSTSITGPYYGKDNRDVTNVGGEMYPIVTHPYKFSRGYGWVGISHCCVFDDGNGNWYFSSQGRFPANVGGNAYSNALMMGHVRKMLWTEDGWPVVMPERYGAVPQVAISESELVGDWELIDLSYSYGNQKSSTTLSLGAEHTVTSSGTWHDAQWSYDAAKQVLTIGSTKLYLQREVDWEASPRQVTIVFAGIGSNNVTYWGKKS